MKKFLLQSVLFTCLVLFISTRCVFAQTPTVNQAVTQKQNGRLISLKQRADNEIQKRVASLRVALTKLNILTRVSSAQKSSFSSQMQTEIDNLNRLKTKIDADPDSNALRTDVTSVVTSYRVYALFIPQIQILVTAEKILYTIDSVTPLMHTLEAQAQEKNETYLQTSLAGITNKLARDKTQITMVINTIIPLTPAGYPANKTILQEERTVLRTTYQDLKTIPQNIRSIIQALKK